MPAYDYKCSCGNSAEVNKSMSAPDPLCPQCGATMTKVFTPVGIAFRGSGFYKTDSRSAART